MMLCCTVTLPLTTRLPPEDVSVRPSDVTVWSHTLAVTPSRSTVPLMWLPWMVSVPPSAQPDEPHVRSTPALVGAGENVESQPVPSPFVSCVISYLPPRGPVMVRVFPPSPVVTTSSQPADWICMKGESLSHDEP